MCGIAGLIALDSSGDLSWLLSNGSAMANTIIHRGPNSGDIWVDAESRLVLAHRRLSIVDLSEAGSQPMVSACGRYVIALNGEIYNWKELRQSLEDMSAAPVWRGHSDTEVLLACISKWGLQKTLSMSRGMFALALWDKKEKKLELARDRIGEKPLYYGYLGSSIVFASELKAIRALEWGKFEVDKEALALMLRYGYVPTPYSIYRGIKKLQPGHIVKIVDGDIETPKKWWDFISMAENAIEHRQDISAAEAVRLLEVHISNAVGEQMLADVPIGALLSGGIDSSTIVSIMQEKSNRRVQTFTVGFSESSYDEAKHASLVAQHLGTEHTEIYISSNQALEVIPHLPEVYDEPFADSSQIPTILISELTKKSVTVCLSGDGGDELFGGYNRYLWASSIWKKIRILPLSTRGLIGDCIASVTTQKLDLLAGLVMPIIPKSYRISNPGDKLNKFSEVMRSRSQVDLYQKLISQWRGMSLLKKSKEVSLPLLNLPLLGDKESFVEWMMMTDTMTYLPDDILVKVDRAGMAYGLETRLPFLDSRLMDFAWNLPANLKIRDGQGKWLLRQLLYKRVPQYLIDRPKQGFGVPIENWLRGPLREWAEDLLSPESLELDGLLDSNLIRDIWNKHLSGRNFQHALWNVLMFQAWRRRWL
jgi:asparagine synthase (glutamine-hydrolysing)